MKLDTSNQRVFVEGPNDGAVINKVIAARLKVDLATPPSHRIIDAPVGEGGFDEALRRFSAALEARRPTRLGLVVDRDALDGKPDRWPSVAAVLRTAGLDAGEAPPAEGVRQQVAWGRVGVWLMPDNHSPGDLESLLEAMLPAKGPLWAHATTVTDQSRSVGARWRDPQRSKACLHAWLAWQDPPGNPYGTAIEAGAFDVSAPAAVRFADWFGWLIGP